MRGGDKLMERVAGQPLLRVMLERALAVADGPVLCALPSADHPRASCLDGLTVTPVVVADAAEGMGASIRAGIKALPDEAAAVMILPADLPELTAEDLATMLTAWREQPQAILRAVDHDGRSGHPVIFPASLFPALGRSRGDTGARDVLHAHGDKVVRVSLPDEAAAVMILPADLPELTSEDLATMLTAWREQPQAILRAVDLHGQSGHPVIFPASLFPALGQSRGDTGARDVLHAHGDKVVRVSLPDRHATTDLDTPEDWANWRARR
jgi:CTP:molybdopterin cytidylyltransferase MocA